MFGPADERFHAVGVASNGCEEWLFSWWAPDGSLGGVTGYRLVGPADAWYWWALARAGEPLLHVAEFDITRRADPMIAKSEAMWAEYTCESAFEQWTLGNETYAVLLDDPDEALGRAYGEAVPIASDLEWYATGVITEITPAKGDADTFGYEQHGVVHGVIELSSGTLDLAEVRAHRLHRWSATRLAPWAPPIAVAHLGLRAPFRFPDGSTLDLVLTSGGWRTRPVRSR